MLGFWGYFFIFEYILNATNLDELSEDDCIMKKAKYSITKIILV